MWRRGEGRGGVRRLCKGEGRNMGRVCEERRGVVGTDVGVS